LPLPLLTCHVLDTGYCSASEHHLIRGGRRMPVHCHSIVALLKHPVHGWLLWDTGYAPRMLDATRRLPYRLYRWMTPLSISADLAIVGQLSRFGLSARDVRTVILSHFHADHTAGLLDFPEARIVASRAGYEDVARRSGWSALRRACLLSLLPADLEARADLVTELTRPPLGPLGLTHDLFGDGSVRLVALPGHARGQLGMLAQTEQGPRFFVADGCFLSRSYRDNIPPHWMTHGFIDNVREMHATIANLHAFAWANPDVALIPTHCPQTFATFVGRAP
jgi:glyoxylase-like metal-dependent hydrolase (beta-lactamase superfamily II)